MPEGRVTVRIVVLVLAAVLLAGGASGQTPDPTTRASGVAFASVFGTAFQKGDLSAKPWGIAGGATTRSGAGIGARWSTSDELDYWSIGFLHVMPSIRGAKSLQPTASLAFGRAKRGVDRAACLEIGGGIDVFLAGPIGLGVDFRYLRGLKDLGANTLREQYVSFAALWRF